MQVASFTDAKVSRGHLETGAQMEELCYDKIIWQDQGEEHTQMMGGC